MSDRIYLPFSELAPLVDENRAHIARPFHDAATNRDCITNGHCLLTWDGSDFAVRESAPDIAPLIEPVPVIGEAPLSALIEWAWLERCHRCGTVSNRPRYGRLGPAAIDCGLLERWLRPLKHMLTDKMVLFRSRGDRLDPIQIVGRGERWMLMIMPANVGDELLTEPDFRFEDAKP
jgi:hypothetical protein